MPLSRRVHPQMMLEDRMQKLAELFAIGLAVPAIVLAVFVLVVWAPTTLAGLRNHRRLNSTQLLILGVFVGFAGSVCDNLYWSVLWLADYLEMDGAKRTILSGAYFNVFCRQLSGIVAAYCHIKSAAVHEKSGKLKHLSTLWLVTTLSFAVGALLMVMLSS